MSATKRTKNSNAPEVTAKYYLTNSRLLPEVIKAKEGGRLTEELAKMLMMLTRKYAMRPCFSGYTYREDMISEALANLCQNALKFNPEKSDNPFAFYTSCINNSFLQFLNIEKKHRRIRDQLLIDMGENPSYNFSDEVQRNQGGEYSNELNELTAQIAEAKVRVAQEAARALAEKEALELEAQAAALAEAGVAQEIEIDVEVDFIVDEPADVEVTVQTLFNF